MKYLEESLVVFLVLSAVLMIFIVAFVIRINRRSKIILKWNTAADAMVSNAIFKEETEGFSLDDKLEQKYLSNKFFIRLVNFKIVSASKSLSGDAAARLQELYHNLGLVRRNFLNINSNIWYIKAKAIQESGILKLYEHIPIIKESTNHKNQLIRMEAQNVMLKLLGANGLVFLDTLTFPISEWQQINLLRHLASLSNKSIPGVDSWLSSKNSTIVVFSLKLARNYHRFDLYNQILNCLEHPDVNVRLEAIKTLSEVYTQDTCRQLIDRFEKEEMKLKIAIIKAVQCIGEEVNMSILLSFLSINNNELKLALVRAIAKNSPTGIIQLQSFPQANDYPLSEIIKQVRGEFLV